MLYTTSVMTDQVRKCNMNNALLLENTFSVKEEECQNDDFPDVKLDISETAIIIDDSELQGHLFSDEMKQYDPSSTLNNIKTELLSTEVQHNNLKIEDGICPNNIKIEFNNGLLYCGDCRVYYEDFCTNCRMLVQILSRTDLTKTDITSQEKLPDGILEIQDYFGESHVFALKVIPVGVRFGPFTGLNRPEHSWRIKGGKFVVEKDKSKYLNWMQYVNHAKNISERNLLVFQYEHNLYYQSTRQIQRGDELLVYFGEEYADSLNRNIEMAFIPSTEHILKDAFACTFCCLGFSSKSYLVKHKTICPTNADRGSSIEVPEFMQCPSCKIHLDEKEYLMHHMAYCCKINDRKHILPTLDNRLKQGNRCKTRPRLFYRCQQCKYSTKYKEDLKNHTILHYKVKLHKCGVCCRRFKTKEVLRLHVENAHVRADRKEDWESSIGDYMNRFIKTENSCPPDETEQLRCSFCEFQTKYKISLKRHTESKHLKEFKYKCDKCEFKTNRKSCLKTHIKAKHLKKFKDECDKCDYKTNRKSQLKMRMEGKHLKEYKYKCDTCEYKTNFRSGLKRHIEGQHLKEFKHECDMCDYKTYTKFNLKLHIEVRHLREFKFKCGACKYKANRKSHLKRHIETIHLREFKYKCDGCDYKTNNNCHLKTHIETRHLKEFKYKCDACEYKTNQKTNLKKHIERRHSKQFEYNCDKCAYKTNLKAHLTEHIEKRHLKEFKCDTCNYNTNYKSHLKRHIEGKHLKELNHKCNMCDYKTYINSNLKRHIEAKHNDDFTALA